MGHLVSPDGRMADSLSSLARLDAVVLFHGRICMSFLAWIVVGLIAGWLTGKVMKGEGYGVC
jgi:F0F1-type ATP synthase assembly protein I